MNMCYEKNSVEYDTRVNNNCPPLNILQVMGMIAYTTVVNKAKLIWLFNYLATVAPFACRLHTNCCFAVMQSSSKITCIFHFTELFHHVIYTFCMWTNLELPSRCITFRVCQWRYMWYRSKTTQSSAYFILHSSK